MDIKLYQVGPLATNCYLVTCETTGESVIVDPGGVSDELMNEIQGTSVRAVLLTHGHFDHIAGVNTIVGETGAGVYIHPLDAPMLTDPGLNGSFMIGEAIRANGRPEMLAAGGEFVLGASKLRILHTPGHTRGGVSFLSDSDFIIAGDTLFKMSVGRWDLPGGNYETLMNTIRHIFGELPETMHVLPGHGAMTTIGFEKRFNQFME